MRTICRGRKNGREDEMGMWDHRWEEENKTRGRVKGSEVNSPYTGGRVR